jgi:MFS family permease
VTDSRTLVPSASGVDSLYAWTRLAAAVGLGTVGGVGMWSMPVVLPAVQAEFAVARGEASLPFTLSMFGFALGGVAMGRLRDRFGILAVAALGIATLAGGYSLAALAPDLWSFALASALIGFGASATFGPLMADVSFWFTTRRGIAVAIAAAGNYLAGTVWPPLIQHFVGRRASYFGIGLVCLALMSALLPALRRPAPRQAGPSTGGPRSGRLDVPPGVFRCCCASPGSRAALRWRCRRCTSSPIAAISAMASPAAPRCCR